MSKTRIIVVLYEDEVWHLYGLLLKDFQFLQAREPNSEVEIWKDGKYETVQVKDLEVATVCNLPRDSLGLI